MSDHASKFAFTLWITMNSRTIPMLSKRVREHFLFLWPFIVVLAVCVMLFPSRQSAVTAVRCVCGALVSVVYGCLVFDHMLSSFAFCVYIQSTAVFGVFAATKRATSTRHTRGGAAVGRRIDTCY